MEKKLSIKLVRSPLGRLPKQRATVKALGLRKMHSVVELPANDAVKGMVAKVAHLVQVEEI
ncbi:50S ribosomal protein L30 [Entomospira culicis]|uniref:Large ribosomal subunit protein uL30 n=1 Tax=Entomospira culicis TaxID=2719989 RepID=A0A968GJN3_9SPIO|nr:50S ribosomal protein L30 [Entomospira culicis]NIZ19701.1 50S ribosomal protein L30 [Entomospira culicis]NIZ69915.1 50S ribosomal protein L30 [Entomospira culicis]WDI37020.1 50S ribosomal protein L30 [Entomospira culicis]WDI38649.1 50S ribosomal protein L30 [Entomospira culicis]